MPLDFDKKRLADVLRRHPSLQFLDDIAVNSEDSSNGDSSDWVHTLAHDLRLADQVATVRFRRLPAQLGTLARNDQLPIDVHISSEKTDAGVDRERDSHQTIHLTIDQHFNGITVLVSPPAKEHQIDVLAVSGLGSHPFGSFMHKGDGHMWLSDSLPRDMPAARVMIYGYESGLQRSTSFAGLDDLAGSLQIAIYRLLRSGHGKRLVPIGHSLGGLLIKEVLIRMAESASKSDLINRVAGCLFFGVPNDGIDTESLIPIVNDQPNRFLLESLNSMNPQISRIQKRNFSGVLSRAEFEIFCFYETRLSPTAAKVGIS